MSTQTSPEREFIHELKNRLTVAMGQCRLIETRLKDPEKASDIPDLIRRVVTIAENLTKMNQLADERRAAILSVKLA